MTDTSVGMIVVSDSGHFLLVQHTAGHWSFPKGHAEEGEDDLAAARRELLEESGLSDIEIPDPMQLIERYEFVRDQEHVTKTVRYFIARARTEELGTRTAPECEIRDVRWCAKEEALMQLTFPEARTLLLEAVQVPWVATHLAQVAARV